MGRIIGLIGCTCLVIAAVRLTNLQHTDHTLKGGEDRTQASRRLSAREHYKVGKEYFLRGKYRDAVQHLTAAVEPKTGLTATERRQADDYLSRANQRLLGNGGATVRAQSDSAWEVEAAPEAPPAGHNPQADAMRNRVDKLMAGAYAARKKGDKQEARKLAQLASQFAKDANIVFGKNETTPAMFLAQLQNPEGVKTQSAVTTANASPDWAADDLTVGKNAPQQKIQQASAELDTPQTQRPATSSQPLSAREQAIGLLNQARADLKAGRYDEARQKALVADELDVIYDLFDDRPELVMNELDRLTETKTFARNHKKTKIATQDVAQASGTEQPAATARPAAGPANASAEARKQQAIRLLEQAREEMNNGNLDAAQAKAEQAEQLNAAFGLFDDMPELVMNQIAARRAAEGLAQSEKAAQKPVTGASAAAKPQALNLLAKARQALNEERLDEARQLAIEADRLKASYDLFDDRPDLVLQEVARIAKRGPATGGTPISESKAIPEDVTVSQTEATEKPAMSEPAFDNAGRPKTGDAKVNAAAARQNLSPSQKEAIELLAQARQLMKAGRHEEARAKALEAEQMNVTFPVFADRPDLVLSDLDAKAGQNVASRSKPARSTNISTAVASETAPVDPSANPFSPDGRRSRVTEAAGRGYDENVVQADTIGEISSASELYNRGMRELSRKNREGAYASFLAAHQTGQKLDPVKTQRLQDYLRELAPRNTRSHIQQTAGQVADNDIAQFSNDGQPAPAPLDAAHQENMVRFDRLRADVLNVVFKAERLKSSDPEAGLTLVDQTMAKVEGSELPEESTAALMKQLNKTRSNLQNEMVRQKPNLETKAKNKEVLGSLERDMENKQKIEQELAKLVEEFNDLSKQQRFAEAEMVAKKAKALAPKEPITEQMYWKAVLARRVDSNDTLKRNREESFWKQLDDVEQAALVKVNDKFPMEFGDNWEKISKMRKGKYPASNRKKGEEELRIESSLTKRISLHEDQVPLAEVIKKIQAVADVNIVLDAQGLEEEGASTNVPVSIEVDGIQVKSALNLILSRYNLAYMIDNEVLKITSRMRQQGELKVEVYSVADLVVPIPDPNNQMVDPFGGSTNPGGTGAGQFSVPPTAGQGFAQAGQNGPFDAPAPRGRQRGGNNMDPDFTSLTELIVSTIAPDSWDQVGGPASIRTNESTLSLVIRQTQKVHEEIIDLLDQLRRLQDLQVTIEVRFVTVSDRFFERIGIDFQFNMQPTTGLPTYDNSGLPLQTFGSVSLPQFGLAGNTQQGQAGVAGVAGQGGVAGAAGGQQGVAGGQQAGVAGVAGQQGVQGAGGGAAGFFGAGPQLNLQNLPNNTSIVGMKNATTFSQDLTIPFTQGSFQVGVPTFGNYNPQAGMEMGMAILSDIEAFFFIQAAQGDQRNNLLFAPKVTVFNGQTGTVTDSKARPFVTSLIPTVGFASTGFQPVITTINEGITLSVTAVVSSDRRFVRLSVNPLFSSITDVFTFSFIGGGGGQGQQGGQAGGQQGQNQQGGQGGFGGGQFGGGGGGGQQGFGIGGGQIGGQGGFGGGQGGQIGGQGGGQQGQGGQRGGAAGTITVQQPVVEQVRVLTTVSVPDGGTILLGGIKRLKEGRNMSGVPILNKIPYVSRLFKNTGVGRETESLMLMITPRIIIQEEEEELLGLPRT